MADTNLLPAVTIPVIEPGSLALTLPWRRYFQGQASSSGLPGPPGPPGPDGPPGPAGSGSSALEYALLSFLDNTGSSSSSVPYYSLPASESLAAGALCNVWSNTGVANLRNADNTVDGKYADVFVLAAYNTSDYATFYFPGQLITGLTLSPGVVYFLGASGAVTSTAPSSGVSQIVGKAVSATTLLFSPQTGIFLG